jgi:hypothetical protein
MTFPFIAVGIGIYQNGFENSIGLLVPLIMGIIFIRFVFIELSFRFISRTGMNKLTKIIGIKTRHNKELRQKTSDFY